MNADSRRVAIVTGGNSGIGKHTAQMLAERRFDVIVTGRNRRRLGEVASAARRIVSMRAEMTVEADLVRVVERAVEDYGRIDTLVNNAGAFVAGPLADLETDQLRHLLDVNVVGPVALSRLCAPHLEQTGGAIVNVSSTMGHKAAPDVAGYAASKACTSPPRADIPGGFLPVIKPPLDGRSRRCTRDGWSRG